MSACARCGHAASAADLEYDTRGDLACRTCRSHAVVADAARRREQQELDPVGGPFRCARCGSEDRTILGIGELRGATVTTTYRCSRCGDIVTKRHWVIYVAAVFGVIIVLLKLAQLALGALAD